MKLPLWCKGKDGKYHRFPYEILQTLPDGRLGLSFQEYLWFNADKILQELCAETGWGTEHFFDYSPTLDAYILKGGPDK